ncbi:MAG: hypothetical protein IH614_12505 [Desulfuromonadales bacterium]|nr:hypothetical protein [Desulfuromonadales bacterium]
MLFPRSGLLLIAVWLLVSGLWILQINTGVADNGDFRRSSGWLLEKPVGFSSEIPPLGSPERALRYHTLWHPYWEYRENVENWPTVVTSFHLFLGVGYLANQLAGLPHYSLIASGLVSRVLLFLILIGVGKVFFAKGWLVASPLFLFILNDSSYISYLNSLYQEHAAIILLPLLILSIGLALKNPGGGYFFFATVTAFLFAQSKVQYFMTPALLAAVLLLVHGCRKSRVKPLIALLLGVQLLALQAPLANEHSAHNSYNALFSGALFFDQRYYPPWLEAEMRGCVGVPSWSREPNCFDRFQGEVTWREVLDSYRHNPVSAIRGMDYGIRHLNRIDLNPPYSRQVREVVSLESLVLVNVWSRVKGFASGWLVYPGIVFPLVIAWRCRKKDPVITSVVLFLVAFTLSQVAVSVLGEGAVDLKKHLLLGNLALDLAAVIALLVLLRQISTQWRKGREYEIAR